MREKDHWGLTTDPAFGTNRGRNWGNLNKILDHIEWYTESVRFRSSFSWVILKNGKEVGRIEYVDRRVV